MPRLFSMLAALALVVTAASGCKDALASPTLGPALEAQRAMPAQSPNRYAGHRTISCATTATTITLTMSDSSALATELFFFSTSANVVRLYTTNGVAAAQGIPLCKTAGDCLNGVSLPVQPHMVRCQADSSATTIHVFGVAR
jgi:hypothetical protein